MGVNMSQKTGQIQKNVKVPTYWDLNITYGTKIKYELYIDLNQYGQPELEVVQLKWQKKHWVVSQGKTVNLPNLFTNSIDAVSNNKDVGLC